MIEMAATTTPDPEDEIRAEFLKDLDDAEHVTLRDWELGFVESNLSRTTFSEKQRIIIDRMRDRYLNRL